MNYYFKDKRFKTRAWTFIVYPDSAPDDWRDILDDLHIPWCESPLHDKDQNPTGEQKKAHWHVLLYADGPKSFDNVSKLIEGLNCPEIRPCNSIVGLVRYFAHLDNPEKYQYDKDYIIGHAGFDVDSYLAMRPGEEMEQVATMMDFVVNNCILEYFDLVMYARQYRQHDWFPLLAKSYSYFMKEFIASYRRSLESDSAERK